MTTTVKKSVLLGMASFGLALTSGCHIDMWRQNKVLPQSQQEFFQNRMGSRPLPAGVVPSSTDGSTLHVGNPVYTGMDSDKHLLKAIPLEAINKFSGSDDRAKRLAMLKWGEERFNIYCSPCHGRLGDGNGMISQRGLILRRKPASYHTERLRRLPDGHIYDVITNGFGVMYPYASRIPETKDRWAIVAYVRALQHSQNAKPTDVPPGVDLDKPAEAEGEAGKEAVSK